MSSVNYHMVFVRSLLALGSYFPILKIVWSAGKRRNWPEGLIVALGTPLGAIVWGLCLLGQVPPDALVLVVLGAACVTAPLLVVIARCSAVRHVLFVEIRKQTGAPPSQDASARRACPRQEADPPGRRPCP